MKKRITDYTEIIRIYNSEGHSEAYAYIQNNYGIKNPYHVVKRMKECNEYHYDKESDRFVEVVSDESDSVFMNIDELCGKTDVPVTIPSAPSMDELIKELLEDRLLQLSRYVQLNQAGKTILVDKSSMLADGYQVVIH